MTLCPLRAPLVLWRNKIWCRYPYFSCDYIVFIFLLCAAIGYTPCLFSVSDFPKLTEGAWVISFHEKTELKQAMGLNLWLVVGHFCAQNLPRALNRHCELVH